MVLDGNFVQCVCGCYHHGNPSLPQVVCGRWLINGYPKVILFDLGSAWKKLAQWRKELYELCNIGWHDAETESHNALVFGNLVCWFISEVREERRRGRGEERGGEGRGGHGLFTGSEGGYLVTGSVW